MRHLTGAKIRIVAGYKGSASVKAAILNGEVHGICGLGWSTIKSFWKAEVDSGEFKPIIQTSGAPLAELGAIPHTRDFTKTEADRQLAGILLESQILGRVYAMPPGVPASRVAAMRKAFMDTMRDPKFLEEAARTGIDISPMDGEETAALWQSFFRTPPDVIERAKKVMSPQ